MTAGFVTTAEMGSITPDDELIAVALENAGVRVRPVAWDREEPPADVSALVLRSPWNYHLSPDAFLSWIDRAAAIALVLNDPETVRWNSHKGYLFELQRAGIPIAETVLCARGSACDLGELMRARGWDRAVVKPAISASSFMTSIAGTHPESQAGALHGRVVENGQEALERILGTRDALIQPFMPAILERGERCLVFIDGLFSHAVRKAPFTDAPGGGRPVRAEPHEIDIGLAALAYLPRVPLYARVDLLRDSNGRDRLMEFELIDPELYMRFDAAAPAKFASALLRGMRAVSG